jgi:hypothetical protein
MGERERLMAEVGDAELVRYFYLDKNALETLAVLDAMKLALCESQDEVPFNAQVKGYLGARDGNGDAWIVKPVASDEEMLYHRSCLIAYLLDRETGTFAAPTTALLVDGKKFRATKVVKHAMQISSYNYLEAPFIDLLRADLVNRWIYFDEDRNPNNYLVVTNAANRPFMVAIDYDKADMTSTAMKIMGTPGKFGWIRTEKTRFLTLLRPEHFEGVCIAAFEERLRAFTGIPRETLLSIAQSAFSAWCPDADVVAARVTANLIARRDYVDAYFRSMFKSAADTVDPCHDEEYSAFGQSFLDMHNKKK